MRELRQADLQVPRLPRRAQQVRPGQNSKVIDR